MDKIKKIEVLVKELIGLIGDNPDREGLLDTPKRVAKAYLELFKGYDEEQEPKITIFKNGSDGLKYDEMIVDTGDFSSFCEHHMLSFIGKYYFAYIPDKKIIGLSKIARTIDWYSSKLQVQERLTVEIVDKLDSLLEPNGMALVLKASHSCKKLRGVKKAGQMTTSKMTGAFKRNIETRQEFFSLIK